MYQTSFATILPRPALRLYVLYSVFVTYVEHYLIAVGGELEKPKPDRAYF